MMTSRKKSWNELIRAVRTTFRKWGARNYVLDVATGPLYRKYHHSPEERRVAVKFKLHGKEVQLTCESEWMAHDNLERLSRVLEIMRLAYDAKIDLLLAQAYRQCLPGTAPAPTQPTIDESDPYAVLGVGRHYPLAVIESIWKARLRVEHPDAGGKTGVATKLNAAMADIRKRRAS